MIASMALRIFSGFVILVLAACQPVSLVDAVTPTERVMRQSMQRSGALVVTPDENWKPTALSLQALPGGVEAASATPITHDGYFLTSAHVLRAYPSGTLYLKPGGRAEWRRARLVWADPDGDLALLHLAMATAGRFEWSESGEILPPGAPVFQVGMITGDRPIIGRLLTPLKPASGFSGERLFRMNLQLQPGDSGGAVLDGRGRLLGVNCAVIYHMPGMKFAYSEGVRPNLRKLQNIIQADRTR